MDILVFMREIMPTAGVCFGAYLAIRVDLAKMNERLVSIRENVIDAKKSADDAHDRINRMNEK